MESVLSASFPGKRKRLIARFYTTRSLRHTIEMRFRTITVRVADTFRSVPDDIIRILALILLAKLFGMRIDKEMRRQYKGYVEEHILPHHPSRRRRISNRYIARGKHFDLNDIFLKLNGVYFDNALPKPRLGWSLNNSYTRLGFYSADRQLLVISRIFDNSKVPLAVLEYLVYHEMLHIFFPVQLVNGRRHIHTPEFRKRESAFPSGTFSEQWLKKNLRMLK
jgi:predicted metal-dependent hydrolase